MPPKVKSTQSNSSAKGKQAKSSPSASGTTTPVVPHDETDVKGSSTGRVSRPDKAAYDAEQNSIKKEIEALEAQMSAIQTKISYISSSGSSHARKDELRAELDQLRQEQSKSKQSRGKVLEQLKALNEGVQKKVKDLQAARSKAPFKTVAEIDVHVKHLDKQVESGTMKLADEKRALQEISQCKRSRRTVEGFQAEQDAIEKDRAQADELRKLLDDPDWKATSDRYDAIKAEMDELKKEGDEVYANRNKLYEERNELKRQVDELYAKKRESAQAYKAENDKYWAKVHADRAKAAERVRAQRAADEEAKKKDQADRIREEASAPAFQNLIEDCQTLIDYFCGKTSGTISLSTSSQPLSAKQEIVGVPKLELRQVEADVGAGLVARKKKGEEEESYFVASKGKGKGGRKGGAKTNGNGNTEAAAPTAAIDTEATGHANFNAPLPILSALLSLSIPPPTSKAEIPRVVEDLKTKKSWYEANQARVTAENVAKAEATISKLLKGSGKAPQGDVSPLGDGENPPEPTSTPVVDGNLAVGVASEAVDEQLEVVGKSQDAISV